MAVACVEPILAQASHKPDPHPSNSNKWLARNGIVASDGSDKIHIIYRKLTPRCSKPECSFSGFRDYPFFTFIPKGRAISTLADMWLKPKAAISANSMGVTLIQALASQPPWIYWRAPRFTHTGKRKISTFYIYWFLSVAYWVVSGFLPTFLATHRSYEFFHLISCCLFIVIKQIMQCVVLRKFNFLVELIQFGIFLQPFLLLSILVF